MNNEDAHACRAFVLSIFGIVVITLLLMVCFYNGPSGGNQRRIDRYSKTEKIVVMKKAALLALEGPGERKSYPQVDR